MLVFVENGKREKKHWSPGGGELSHYKKGKGCLLEQGKKLQQAQPLAWYLLKLNPSHIG